MTDHRLFNTNTFPVQQTYKDLYFVPDYVEMVGRYMLLLRHGPAERAAAFVQARQQAVVRLQEVSKGIIYP